MTEIPHKICTRCGIDKPLVDPETCKNNFYFRKDRNYCHTVCVLCDAVTKRKWRDDNPGYSKRKSRRWEELHPERVKFNKKKYRPIIRLIETKNRNELADSYLIKVIREQFDFQLQTIDIPKELIELKRASIILKRKIKNNEQTHSIQSL